MKKILFVIVIVTCAPSIWGRSNSERVFLDELLKELPNRNPSIRAAYQSWQVMEFETESAGTWPDPKLKFSREKEAGPEGMRMDNFGASQEIPFPGKRGTEKQMKKHEALIAKSNYEKSKLDAESELRQLYFQLYLTDQLLQLTQDTADAWRQTLNAAQVRVASGASAADVFSAQTELEKMEIMNFEQEQQRRLIETNLNYLFDWETEKSWGPAEEPSLIDIPVSLEKLEQAAATAHPIFAAAEHETMHGKSMLRLNQLNFTPDLEIMAERRIPKEGPSGHEVGVSISVPLWFQRPWNDLKAAKEHLRETEAESDQLKAEVKKMVHREFIETTTHLSMARRYESRILPLASAQLALAREQYASGQADFMRLLEAVRTWLETNKEYQEHLYQYAEHWSLLENWVGMNLSDVKKN